MALLGLPGLLLSGEKTAVVTLLGGGYGKKKVDGRRECSTETAYQQLPKSITQLGPC
jgi:hypothetical protein